MLAAPAMGIGIMQATSVGSAAQIGGQSALVGSVTQFSTSTAQLTSAGSVRQTNGQPIADGIKTQFLGMILQPTVSVAQLAGHPMVVGCVIHVTAVLGAVKALLSRAAVPNRPTVSGPNLPSSN